MLLVGARFKQLGLLARSQWRGKGGGSTSHAALSMASWAKAPLPSEGLAVLGDGLYLFGTAVGNHKEIASREPRVRERESAPGRHSQQ